MIVRNGTSFVAVVPARGGSKGIPGKNVRLVGGRPLIAWTIEQVDRAKTPVRLVVSTDDPQIAQLAMELGAEVPVLRPAGLATDEAPTEPAVLHAVSSLEGGDELEHVVLLQATSPIRDDGAIDGAIALYLETGAKSLVSVVEIPPWLWTGTKTAPRPLYDIDFRPRRQDVPSEMVRYRETGSIYVTSLEHLASTGNRLSPNACMFMMHQHEGLDIDDEIDMVMAETWLRSQHVD